MTWQTYPSASGTQGRFVCRERLPARRGPPPRGRPPSGDGQRLRDDGRAAGHGDPPGRLRRTASSSHPSAILPSGWRRAQHPAGRHRRPAGERARRDPAGPRRWHSSSPMSRLSRAPRRTAPAGGVRPCRRPRLPAHRRARSRLARRPGRTSPATNVRGSPTRPPGSAGGSRRRAPTGSRTVASTSPAVAHSLWLADAASSP